MDGSPKTPVLEPSVPGDAQGFEAAFDLTEPLCLEAARLFATCGRVGKNRLALLAVAVVGVVVGPILLWRGKVTGAGALIAGAALVWLYLRLPRSIAAQARRQHRKMGDRRITYRFGAEGVQGWSVAPATTEGSEVIGYWKLRWDQFDHFGNFPDMWLLFSSQAVFHPLPTHLLTPDQLRFIEDSLRANGVKAI